MSHIVSRKIDCIVGVRPNFVKIAPIMRALRDRDGFAPRLVHTGQHYDVFMNAVFFDELGIPTPDINLDVGSGTGTEQTARIMLALEPVFLARRPDLVVVVGDVNSTMAAALVAAKLNIPIAHVEAGLRSFDRTMPERHSAHRLNHTGGNRHSCAAIHSGPPEINDASQPQLRSQDRNEA